MVNRHPNFRLKSTAALSASILSIAALAPSAFAAPDGKRTNRLLEEVVVTAQKREENSQEIPITISAFSSEKLDAFGIDKVEDLGRITPGLTFTVNVGYTVIYLRGVGADAFLPSADPSIATYVDGINKVSGHGLQNSLGPIERVEVLKGPQGTLFGRNATGGAVNIISANPPEEFIGNVSFETADYQSWEGGTQKADIFIGAPITENLGFTLGAYTQDYDPTMLNERVRGSGVYEDPMDHYSKGVKAKIRWDVTDSFALTLLGDYNDQNDPSSMIQENTRPAAVLAAGQEADKLDRIYHNSVEGVAGTQSDTYTIGLIADWQTDALDYKLILSDQYFDNYYSQLDYDTSEYEGASFDAAQFADQQTAELQLLSNDNSWQAENLEWVIGLYYLKAEAGFDYLHLVVDGLGLGAGALGIPNFLGNLLKGTAGQVDLFTAGVLATESMSTYGQATWTFNPEFSVTLGARYQKERRNVFNTYLSAGTPIFGGEFEAARFVTPGVVDETFSPRVALQWFVNDDIQLYTSLARGYKSPTFNPINFFSAPDVVRREEATAFELGVKSEWLDGNLRLNAAVFKTQVKDLLNAELSITSGGVVRFSNAGTGEIEGAEFDFLWQPMPDLNPGLAITGNATYLDAKYADFPNGSGFDDETGLAFGPQSVTGDTSRDFSGNRIVRTPEYSSSASINQNIALTDDSALEIAVDYFYSDFYYTAASNSEHYVQPQYELWNARASYFYYPWGLQITAFGENIKNKEYYISRQAQDFGRADTLAAPGIVGLRVKWEFDTVM
ncbi:TonB-dependent receptor [gamma proteobacterium BDW918]|jgi:iron complex outermembrane receptor protein|uniref:Pesticin receptor n=1 Tax=Zhongshania aliphaticivorans TaxID=1470434 RepID=A0A127MA30_9GAMM|nr:TonB-dependent receptor [Zhongshania aliphaticivorans]AMO70102.1 hypothetical protein AZF00_18125 [Zhongshania aliphaticivorans]EIF41708.1 TonB-dependent receptor [gamma proteobacterium BDW918]